MSKDVSSDNAPGMGAIPLEKGVAFRVWAPNAEAVSVAGSFNRFDAAKHPLEREAHGYWYGVVDEARPGDEYKYAIRNGGKLFYRIDPYAKQVTNSCGNAVIYADTFDWTGDDFRMDAWNNLVIYELHIGTFSRRKDGGVGDFDSAIGRLGYLKKLGINAVEVMPVAEFAGDISWGYNPAHIFSVETAYGGPDGFKRFVKAAHAHGIAVILDVVYNHFGPSDLDLWQFDGWSENGKGGIYFYNDWRSSTPWGDTRPDYGRGEVRRYIRDNAMMWVDDFRVDGLRYDMTLYMRTVSGSGDEIPDGWSLAQWINREVRAKHPHKITIAEDLRSNDHITRHEDEGGANFGSQWDAGFVHPVRAALIAADDAHRNMDSVRDAILNRYCGDAFRRVVYTESHDEVANGKARVTTEVNPGDPEGWHALKRSTLGAALTLTSPGIPMLFQGQTMLEDGWFRDTEPLDWENVKRFHGVTRLYGDLIALRRNLAGESRGLSGQEVFFTHVSNDDRMLAYIRRDTGGPGDDTLVVANFSAHNRDNYAVGVPFAGRWVARFNSDAACYRDDLADFPVVDVFAAPEPQGGQPARAHVSVAAYSLSIYTLAKN